MSGDIFLNIDTIVLHGLSHVNRHVLVEALQQALVEQLSLNQGLSATDLARARTNITLPNAFGAEQLGRTLGQSLSDVISNNEGSINSVHETKLGGAAPCIATSL